MSSLIKICLCIDWVKSRNSKQKAFESNMKIQKRYLQQLLWAPIYHFVKIKALLRYSAKSYQVTLWLKEGFKIDEYRLDLPIRQFTAALRHCSSDDELKQFPILWNRKGLQPPKVVHGSRDWVLMNAKLPRWKAQNWACGQIIKASVMKRTRSIKVCFCQNFAF